MAFIFDIKCEEGERSNVDSNDINLFCDDIDDFCHDILKNAVLNANQSYLA